MASYSWKSGTSGGDWNQPAQWSGDVVPAVTDQASVAGASGTITATAASFGTVGFASPNATLQWLPDAGFTLATLAGTFTLSGGTITLGNDAFNQGDAGQGSFNVAGSGTLVDNGTVDSIRPTQRLHRRTDRRVHPVGADQRQLHRRQRHHDGVP